MVWTRRQIWTRDVKLEKDVRYRRATVAVKVRVAGKVAKSGDTMSGNLVIQAADAFLKIVNSGESQNPYIQISKDEIRLGYDGGYMRIYLPTQGGRLALVEQVNDKLNSSSAAPAFQVYNTYAVGDHCTYNGALYRCTTAITTPGAAWDASKWTADTTLANIPYDRITITTSQLQDHAEQKVTLNAATTTLTLPALTDLTGKVSDFGIDVVNGYEVSGTPTAASFSLAGTIGTDYNLIVPEGEDWSEMSALAAGEMAVYYFTLSAFQINDKPTWEVMKKIVTLVPVPSAP